MNNRLYIGNLSPAVGEEELRALFSQKGTVAGVELMRDPATQQSRGFAFVTMATPESAGAALEKFHSYSLGGRNITVTEARPPQEPKGMMREGFEHSRPSWTQPGPQRPQQRSQQRTRRPRRRSR